MCVYTVRQLADMAGVSVRTLHHYDHIDLLKPSSRSAAGYRLYEGDDLIRLQQILLFKEIDLPLMDIRDILDDPTFDAVTALRLHREMIQARAARLSQLLQTIDATIGKLERTTMTLTDEELYEGLTKKQAERYEREAQEMYDPDLVQESKRRIGKMSKKQWQAVKDEGDEVTRAIAALMDRDPDDAAVQAQIARHHAWIEHFYPASADVYTGLGQLYAEHDEFRAFYEQYAPGLADFMYTAMTHHALNVLST